MTSFDRVRPRSPRPASNVTPIGVDSSGKRALFSSASDTASPGVGSALVECSRCNERTVMGLMKALRASFPSLHLGIRVGHRDDVRTVSVFRHDYPTYMRCPACGRPSWVRMTFQI
jgi:transcription elongation factor Elf1